MVRSFFFFGRCAGVDLQRGIGCRSSQKRHAGPETAGPCCAKAGRQAGGREGRCRLGGRCCQGAVGNGPADG